MERSHQFSHPGFGCGVFLSIYRAAISRFKKNKKIHVCSVQRDVSQKKNVLVGELKCFYKSLNSSGPKGTALLGF